MSQQKLCVCWRDLNSIIIIKYIHAQHIEQATRFADKCLQVFPFGEKRYNKYSVSHHHYRYHHQPTKSIDFSLFLALIFCEITYFAERKLGRRQQKSTSPIIIFIHKKTNKLSYYNFGGRSLFLLSWNELIWKRVKKTQTFITSSQLSNSLVLSFCKKERKKEAREVCTDTHIQPCKHHCTFLCDCPCPEENSRRAEKQQRPS